MRNRAKCKLCGDILESFHRHDYVTCKCGEISIDGGEYYTKCSARDWRNFLRVDDEDNEIIVTVVDTKKTDEPIQEEKSAELTKQEIINTIDHMIKTIENLPENAKTLPANQYDLCSILLILLAFLKLENK